MRACNLQSANASTRTAERPESFGLYRQAHRVLHIVELDFTGTEPGLYRSQSECDI
jgi:hypothetical protein